MQILTIFEGFKLYNLSLPYISSPVQTGGK